MGPRPMRGRPPDSGPHQLRGPPDSGPRQMRGGPPDSGPPRGGPRSPPRSDRPPPGPSRPPSGPPTSGSMGGLTPQDQEKVIMQLFPSIFMLIIMEVTVLTTIHILYCLIRLSLTSNVPFRPCHFDTPLLAYPPSHSPPPPPPPPTLPLKAALIMQVLSLSDEQIQMLPPDQRNSILKLKEQISQSN